MTQKSPSTVVCQICGKDKKIDEALVGELVRPALVEVIRQAHPQWNSAGYICLPDINSFLRIHFQHLLEEEKGELSQLEHEVVLALSEEKALASNINVQFDRELTVGEKMADKVAEFGGSWTFLIAFLVFCMVWIGINSSALLLRKPFDIYPFILLNLLLSCLAAVQAPVIMMSQNRQEAKDRLRAEHDYRVNLKAELEIRVLSQKLDRLLSHQWQRLLEIQQIQMDFIQELTRKS